MKSKNDNTPRGTLRRRHEINAIPFAASEWSKILAYYGAKPDGDDGDKGRVGEDFTDRHIGRLVQGDGIAIMRFLSRYLQRGETPLELVQDLARQAGFDVPECAEEVCE